MSSRPSDPGIQPGANPSPEDATRPPELDAFLSTSLELLRRIAVSGISNAAELHALNQQNGRTVRELRGANNTLNGLGGTLNDLRTGQVGTLQELEEIRAGIDRIAPPARAPKPFLEPQDDVLIPGPTSRGDQAIELADRLSGGNVTRDALIQADGKITAAKELLGEVLKGSIYNGQNVHPNYTKKKLDINDEQFFAILQELARRGYADNPEVPGTGKVLSEVDFRDRYKLPGFIAGIRIVCNNVNPSVGGARLFELMKPYIERIRILNLSSAFLAEYPF